MEIRLRPWMIFPPSVARALVPAAYGQLQLDWTVASVVRSRLPRAAPSHAEALSPAVRFSFRGLRLDFARPIVVPWKATLVRFSKPRHTTTFAYRQTRKMGRINRLTFFLVYYVLFFSVINNYIIIIIMFSSTIHLMMNVGVQCFNHTRSIVETNMRIYSADESKNENGSEDHTHQGSMDYNRIIRRSTTSN